MLLLMSPGSNPSRRVSLRDVARVVGVSHVAISLALRDDPRVSPARRREILATAEKLGYRPDPMLSSLAAYRKGRRATTIRSTIAWINQWPDSRGLRKLREFDAYWKGANAAAEELGYRLEEFSGEAAQGGGRLEKILVARGVRGILIPPHHGGFELPHFAWSEFAIVRLGQSVPHPRAHVVANDQLNSARLAFEQMQARGYARIGFVTSRRFDRDTAGHFRAGFLEAQDAAPGSARWLPPFYIDEPAQARDAKQLSAWLKAAKPDAVISSHSELRRMLAEIGVRVPGDLAAAATSVLDGNFDAGIDQNCQEIGRVATRTLAGLIHQNERGVPLHYRRILVEGRWVDGVSLPRVR